ncbi:MAG: hypothetical protein KDA93_18640 [Planctomycetaceae bacterium]|nr:hypothetical protein [Planctomycetaceae bacterium]
MPLCQSEVENFYHYATWMVENRELESLDDCLKAFRKEQEATIESIKEGLADVKAGRTQPFEEAMAEIRKELGFPEKQPI